MQRGAHSTHTGIELAHHAFYLLAKTGLVEVQTKHIGTAVQTAQAAPVLVFLANLQRCHNGLQLAQQGVGRGLKRGAVVLDAFQIAGVAGQREGDEHQIAHVQAAGNVLLDGLAETDGQLLARVHGDALRGVGHEGVGQATVDHGADKLIRVQHTGIGHYGHRLHVAYLLDETAQVGVGHLGRDEGVAQQAAVDRHGGVKGVQAGGHLHRLYLVYRVARGVEGAAKVQRRTAVGVVVFYHQILHLLGIHKGGREGVLRRLYVVVVFKTVGGQQLLYLLVRARCYLVYHRPGEGHLRLVGQILQETLGHQTVVHPALGIGQHTGLHLVAVVRAVVHALHRQRKSTGLIALPQQGAHLAHGQHGR